MIKEAVGFGDTVDEAKEDAMLALGASTDDDVQIEIIEMPKKKVLGVFGGSRAKVRVFVELPDKEEKAPAKKQKENKQKEKQQQKIKTEKKEETKTTKKAETAEYPDAVPAGEIAPDTKPGRAVAYLKSILSGLGCENVEIKVAVRENSALLSLEGEDLGVVIGRRGETLEALQMLVSLAANGAGGYYRVNINIGDYREKREQALISLANRMAKQVLATGKNRTLEPMSPYERRIIHTAIQTVEGVQSNSIGEGENRRVVIHPEGKSVQSFRDNRRPRGGSRGHKPSNTVVSDPSRQPLKDSDVPLYGKIEK